MRDCPPVTIRSFAKRHRRFGSRSLLPASDGAMNSTTTRRILRIAPMQMGKVFGLIHGLLALMFVPFLLLIAVVAPFNQRSRGEGIGMAVAFFALAILAPIFYGVMGFVTGAVGAAIYNAIAARIGGIELEFDGPDRD